jgi:hypothetical protein
MGWTDLSTWDGDWAKRSFLKQFVDARNERYNFTRAPNSGGSINVPSDVQDVYFWRDLQTDLFPDPAMSDGVGIGFLRTRNADGSARPAWGTSGYEPLSNPPLIYTPEQLWEIATAGASSAGPTRYTVHPSEGGTPSYGLIQAGDIIGPWLLEDLQRLYNAMEVVAIHDLQWEHWFDPDPNKKEAEGSHEDSWAEAESAYASAWSVASAVFGVHEAPRASTSATRYTSTSYWIEGTRVQNALGWEWSPYLRKSFSISWWTAVQLVGSRDGYDQFDAQGDAYVADGMYCRFDESSYPAYYGMPIYSQNLGQAATVRPENHVTWNEGGLPLVRRAGWMADQPEYIPGTYGEYYPSNCALITPAFEYHG